MQNNTYTVAQVNNYISGMFKDDLLLDNISIKGEVGTCSYTSVGHIYFSIKDKDSQINAVMWAGKRNSGLKFKLETGMQIVARGRVEVYVRDGKYQLIANTIEQDGVGNIYEEFEKLKGKLEAMGMFDKECKQPIPQHIKTLGVVTASTGAAVRDIINVSKRRNPGIQIVLYPAIVQGKDAPASIIRGINMLEEYGVDTIIVGRGGGSMEDLWCFNDEALAHTIFNCSIPVISAVGHETDFTIADFVADLRAATPSVAAEQAVSLVMDDIRRMEEQKRRITGLLVNKLAIYRSNLSGYKNRVRGLSPQSKINEQRNRLSSMEERLSHRMDGKLSNVKRLLELKAQKLHGLSPLNKLGGGYVYASANGGKALKSAKEVSLGDNVNLNLTDGEIVVKVEEIKEY
ncbi:MAG: exodeoxyribonuclease VII large subunit [Lachnospiraceae bacterium]|nr:exodeoxyribonuclease VII large subunit [Lachnospiraceae bacterium]